MRMKIAVILIFFLQNSCFASEGGKISAEREKARLAAQLVVGKIREELKSLSIAEKDLLEEMKSDSSKYCDPAESWGILRKKKKSGIEEGYKKEIDSLVKNLDSKKPESIKSWFTDEDLKRFLSLPYSEIEQSLDSNFGKKYAPKAANVFNKARSKAVKEQWNKFVFDVHPTEKEFETIPRSELEKTLFDKLSGKIGTKLFLENNEALQGPEAIGRILDDASSQQNAQKQIVEKSDGAEKVAPIDIEEEIRNEIQKYRGELEKKKSGDKIAGKVYGIFPSIEKKVFSKGKELAIKKFFEPFPTMMVPIEKTAFKTWMKKEIERHVERAKSLDLCPSKWSPFIFESMVQWFIDKRIEAGKKAEYRKFLEELIKDDTSHGNEKMKLVENSINRFYDEARNEIVEEQFKEFFEPLTDSGLWKPTDGQIEDYDKKDEIDIPDYLKMPGVSSKEFDVQKLFDETRKKVFETERSLIAEGLGIIRKQRNIVGEVGLQIGEAVPRMFSEKQVKNEFLKAVKKEWAANVLAKKRPSLFASVEKLIEEKAAVIWRTDRAAREKAVIEEKVKKEDENRRKIEEERRIEKEKEIIAEQQKLAEEKRKIEEEKRAAAEKTAKGGKEISDSGGKGGGKEKEGTSRGGEEKDGGAGGTDSGAGSGDGSGEGKGDGADSGPPIKPDLILDFDYDNGKINVKLILPKAKKTVKNVFSMEDFSDSESFSSRMMNLQKFFEEWFKSQIKGNETISVYVVARVFDGRVAYGAVNVFRKCIEAALKNVDNKKIKVFWYDDYFKKENKDKEDVSPKIIERSRTLMV